MIQERERLLFETLTFVADTLVDDFDVVDFLQELAERCAAIISAADVGIVLADSRHQLAIVASTTVRLRAMEAMQLAAGHGPCLDSYAWGEVVTASSPEEIARRWPALTQEVRSSGYQSVHTVPLRLRRTTIGSLTFFCDTRGRLDPDDVRAAQAIADVATIGLVQERTRHRVAATRDQLQHTLDGRIVIEQAKGIIAHDRGVDVDTAWAVLRTRAREHRIPVTDVAQTVVDQTVTF